MCKSMSAETELRLLKPLVDYGTKLSHTLDMSRQSEWMVASGIDKLLLELQRDFFESLGTFAIRLGEFESE